MRPTGFVVVPLFAGASDDQTIDEAIRSEGFDEIADVINALQENDEDLVQIISEMRRQKGQGLPVDRRRFLEKIQVIGPTVDLEPAFESAFVKNLEL